jgi:hypothetical protein
VVLINQALLDQTGFPYTINSEGSYRLASNITVPSGFAGIQINTNDVTIDLNGFSIIGTPGSLDGIEGRPSGAYDHITIRNGFVRTMGGAGIDIDAESLVENVHAVNNGSWGIRVGARSIVRECYSAENGSAGYLGYAGTSFIDNMSLKNLNDGIAANGDRTTIRGNVIDANSVRGIDADDQAVIRGNLVASSGEIGVLVLEDAQINGNAIYDSISHGIRLNWAAVITDTVIRGNGGYGIADNGTSGHSVVIMRSAVTNNTSGALDLYDNSGIGHSAFDTWILGDTEPDNRALEPNYCNGTTNCTVVE